MVSKIDLHIHSKYSFDSFLDPYTILKIAKKIKLNGIAITDHNTIKGGLEVNKINRDNDFLVIIGSEINTEVGDIIGLFLSEEVKSRKSEEVIDEIKKQGGLVILPHPFKYHKNINIVLKKMDAVEGFNSRVNKKNNIMAQQLAIKNKISMVAGSDAHLSSEIGLGRTIFDDVNDMDDVKKAILNNKCKIEGTYSKTYNEILSNIIKSIKTKQIHEIAFIPYRIIKMGFKR